MDDIITSTLENVTKNYFNDQFSNLMEVNEVTVISQSIVENGSRRLGRRLQYGNNPSSSSSSLIVAMGVEGRMTNWTGFVASMGASFSSANATSMEDSIFISISRSISSDELKSQLAAMDPDSFPYEYHLVISTAPTVDGSSRKSIISIIAGAAVALVILVGSMFFMERKSGVKRRRRILEARNDDMSLEQSQYDLNDVTNSQSQDNDSDDPLGIRSFMGSLSNARRNRKGRTKVEEAVMCAIVPCVMNAYDDEATKATAMVNESRLTSLMDRADSTETDQQEKEKERDISALELSPEKLKAAIKRKDTNIFVFTDGSDQRPTSSGNSAEDAPELEIKNTVSSLSNPSQVEEPFSPSSLGGYLGDHFNYTNVEKMIGDQYDTRAIMTPRAPKGNGNSTPSRRTGYSFSSPVSNSTRTRSSRRDKLFDVFAPPGPLGIIIDTTPEGPMIHSLKPTSQLLGLVNPGDLIVGLDGVDTRNMTAATFTRLMAKRSQGERKITLLKGLAPTTPTTLTRG